MKSLAQLDFGTFKGFGPLGNPTGTGAITLTKLVSTSIGVLSLIAFIWFVYNFIIGAIGIISSGGDKQKLESARNKITYSIIGVVVVIASLFVIDLIGVVFGIPFLNLFQLFNLLNYGPSPALPPGID